MSRVASYAIQGFLYQFNKTLIEILTAADDTVITVEGTIEDVDIEFSDGRIEALQCKYHEGQSKYTPSLIFKPLLQMMLHYARNKRQGVRYKLFIHIPDTKPSSRSVDQTEIDGALKSKSHSNLISEINKHEVDIDEFIGLCDLEFGDSLDSMKDNVCNAFKETHLSKDSIDTLFYPNAINEIANISTNHNVLDRKVRKKDFLSKLDDIRSTAISKWTLALASRDKILRSKQRQLKTNLSKNSRNRCFVIDQNTLEDFDSKIVTFIYDYIGKYHFKINHDKPPTFYLVCGNNKFRGIRQRLHDKGIRFTTGSEIRGVFDTDHFFRNPITRKINNHQIETDFQIRVTCHEVGEDALKFKGFDDIYIISESVFDVWKMDVETETLPIRDIDNLKYVLGLSDVIK